MRYFVELAYKGSNFSGWQIQPNAPSVQETIEEALSTILRQKIAVLGCGRTDTGVHASQFYLHFDFEGTLPDGLLHRLNKYIGNEIVFYQLIPVDADAHARFDATARSYVYHINLRKNPFQTDTSFFYYLANKLDKEKMQAAASLLLEYREFAPFCKTNSDAKTMKCTLLESKWIFHENRFEYQVSANRFLRGMVRLIVGSLLQVGAGKTTIESLKNSMDNQSPLEKALSVPAAGLYLCKVEYPFI